MTENKKQTGRVSEVEKIYGMPIVGGCKEFEAEGVRRWA